MISPILCICQINDSLEYLCNQITTVKDSSESNYPLVHRSSNYEFQILNDTLFIETAVKSKYKTADSDTIYYENKKYKAKLKDIQSIATVTERYGSKAYGYNKSFLEVSSLRSYLLFKETYSDGKSKKNIIDTDLISIPIYKLEDTTTFKQLAQLINNEANIKENHIDPNCKFDEIKIPRSENNLILAINENGLEVPIKLNKNPALNDELYTVLRSYIEKENIAKLYGLIVLNSNQKIEYLSSYQNEMHNFYESLDNLSFGMNAVKESGFLKITNRQLNEILNLLNEQNWEVGRCKGIEVNCYFDFSIENKNYKN